MTTSDMQDALARKDAILLEMLPNVTFDGWTRKALRMAGEAADQSEAEVDLLFPNGPNDVLVHLNDWANREMQARLESDAEAFAALKVREKITAAVRARLEVLDPHKEAVRRAAVILGTPHRVGMSTRLVYRAVDTMWRCAGDTATDYNFYTKRALLAGVFTSTTMYWLSDKSPDNERTWAFLDRRIAEVMQFGKGIAQVKKLGSVVETPLNLMARLADRFLDRRTPPTESAGGDAAAPETKSAA